jgi:hypothetical protein
LGDQPLPPSWNIETVPNGVHPITGAPNYTPAQTPMGWWPPGNRPMHTGQAGAIPAGQAGHYSYPYPTHAHEDAPQVPPTRPGGDGDGDGDG